MATRTGTQTTRNQRACTNCRQVKLRCDGAQKFPAACSRCEKNNLQCRTDPDFKRTRTRKRLEEVTNQLNAIKASLAVDPPSTSLREQPSLASAQAQLGDPQTSLVADVMHEIEAASLGFYRFEDLPEDPCLEHTPLEQTQMINLFDHFEENYYRHCPILDTNMSLTTLHQTSSILFWTIIMIASRWHPSLYYIYDSLLDPYRTLLGKTLVEPTHSIESIQAIALRCFWPLSVPRQVDDPSWNFCGILTHAAMRMGLNRVTWDAQGSSPKDVVNIKRKTWMACVYVNCSYAWSAGVAVSAEVLARCTLPPSLPARVEREFVAKVQILQKFARSSSTIINLHPEMDAWNFTQSLCKDLDTIRDAHEAIWTIKMDVLTLGAQLGLYMLQLERGAKLQSFATSIGDRETASSHMTLINLTYMTTTRFIHSFSKVLESSERDGTQVPQRHLPKHYFKLLLLAMAFMFKVKIFHIEDLRASQDQVQAQIRTIYDILSSWSRDKLDEPGRAVRLADAISRNEKFSKLKLNELSSEGRPGLSLLDGFIDTGRRIRESAANNKELDNAHNQIGDNIAGEIHDPTLVGGWQDSLLDWNLPWGLDLSSMEQFDFDIENI